MKTPLGWAASRWQLSPRALRWATTAALIVSIVIVFTGGLVRVTGSGLGCPTWPTCDGTSIASTPELGIHGVIEYGNRLLTGLVIFAVGWAIIAVRLQRPRERWLERIVWSQFWLVVANAIAGGITVLVGLNPWVVAMHFVLAIVLIATTTITWHYARRAITSDSRARHGGAGVSALAWVLAIATLLLILLGTLVTGTGPHSGDSADVPRMAFQWEYVAWAHGLLGAAVFVVAAMLLVKSSRSGDVLVRRRVIGFLIVVGLQGALGLIQAVTGLPEWLVAIHVLGSALVWVGALRVLLDANPTLFVGSRAATSVIPSPSL
jgi:heme a synthase